MQPVLTHVFASLGDFDLADALAGAAEARHGYDRMLKWSALVPEPHKIVSFIRSMTGLAGNSGYVEFMMLDCHHAALPASFRSVGLNDLADVVDHMLAPAVKSASLGNRKALQKHFGGWDSFSEWVNQFEGILFKASDRITDAVAAYCRARPEAFEDLLFWILRSRTWQERTGIPPSAQSRNEA